MTTARPHSLPHHFSFIFLPLLEGQFRHLLVRFQKGLLDVDFINVSVYEVRLEKSSHGQHNENGLRDIDGTWRLRTVDWSVRP